MKTYELDTDSITDNPIADDNAQNNAENAHCAPQTQSDGKIYDTGKEKAFYAAWSGLFGAIGVKKPQGLTLMCVLVALFVVPYIVRCVVCFVFGLLFHKPVLITIITAAVVFVVLVLLRYYGVFDIMGAFGK